MKKIFFALLFAGLLFATGSGIEKGRELVESNASCANLSNEELESIGDYVMELLHPGEQHEFMDRMMGGEGSESLKQAHINMAQRFYCGGTAYGGMMGSGMMGGRMFQDYAPAMHSYQPFIYGFTVIDVLLIILLIGLIIIVYLTIIQSFQRKK